LRPRPPTAEEIAAETDMPAHLVAKTVVCEGDDGYLLVVVPAGWYVDIGRVALAVGARKVRMTPETEIAGLFPFSEVDAVPPLGGLPGLPVYLDRQLANQEFIAFTAGSHHDVIHMKTADFRQIAETTIGTFGCCDYQAEFRKRFLASRKAAGA
jgi:Ala-tRNA(Pro) deacylase